MLKSTSGRTGTEGDERSRTRVAATVDRYSTESFTLDGDDEYVVEVEPVPLDA